MADSKQSDGVLRMADKIAELRRDLARIQPVYDAVAIWRFADLDDLMPELELRDAYDAAEKGRAMAEPTTALEA